MPIPLQISRVLVTLVVLAVVISEAAAISPPYVSDRALAESPVVVVAKWDGAPWDDNSLVEGNVLKEHEMRTQIVVERVIKGHLKVGKHTILVGYAIGWSKDRPGVMSYMSTQVLGDADATKSNLWFLQRKRSRIKTDSAKYLSLESYRGVQPLELEPYFKALDTKQPAAHVPELLQSDNEHVLLRTLELVAGHDPPWPYEPWRFVRPKSKKKPLTDQAELIRLLIQRTTNATVRRFALAVYTHLTGKDGLAFVQTQLTSEDSHVRAIAIGTLARYKGSAAIDLMAKAAVGVEDPHLACEVIKRLHNWNDLSAVPVLIPFLQNDGFSYMIGNDLGIPAIKTQEALRSITGYAFPFDVAASQRAWMTAGHMKDRAERNKYLARVLPNVRSPWKARVFKQEGRVIAEVTNRSKLTFTLARTPSDLGVTYSHGVFGSATEQKQEGKNAFITLKDGQSVTFDLDLQGHSFAELAEKDAECNLRYMSNGNGVGVNAWLGVITAKLKNK